METVIFLLMLGTVAVVADQRPFYLKWKLPCDSDDDCGGIGSTLCGCDQTFKICKDCRECGFHDTDDNWVADMTCRISNQDYSSKCQCEGGLCISCYKNNKPNNPPKPVQPQVPTYLPKPIVTPYYPKKQPGGGVEYLTA